MEHWSTGKKSILGEWVREETNTPLLQPSITPIFLMRNEAEHELSCA